MKRDLYNHEARWNKWKASAMTQGIDGVSTRNSEMILKYLQDMELGINVGAGGRKRPRSPARLITLREKMVYFARIFEQRYGIADLRSLSEDTLFRFFADMQAGNVKSAKGKRFEAVDSYARIFKAFWHWHQKVNRKQGNSIPDITADLGAVSNKPRWVYLDEKQAQRLCTAARHDYRVMFTFLLDTGIRAGTELMNVRVSDLSDDCKTVTIRDETVKTGSFGRRIKLMLCSELLKEFIAVRGLKPEDYLFEIKSAAANKYIKDLAKKLFGSSMSEAGKRYSEIRLYDLRHNSACYWLPRYKSENALMYRFGWKRSDKIHYYTELLGMRDTISDEDMLVDVTKTELEQRIGTLEKTNQVLRERLEGLERAMVKIDELSRQIKTFLNRVEAHAS